MFEFEFALSHFSSSVQDCLLAGLSSTIANRTNNGELRVGDALFHSTGYKVVSVQFPKTRNMDSDFVGDLDGSLLNYIEMDSLKGIPTAENLSTFPSFIVDNGIEHCTSDSSSGGDSNPKDSSSNTSKRRRKPVDPLKKKIRIDYKNPVHAERLNIAITAVIASLEGEPEAFHKNIMLIAKSHNIPYNTLRDNFLR